MNSSYYLISLDLGIASEPTALVIIDPDTEYRYASANSSRIEEENNYDVVTLERFDQGTSFPAIVKRVKKIVGARDEKGQKIIPDYHLLLNITSVGRPALRYFRKAGFYPWAFTLVHGETETWTGPGQIVAKKSVITSALIAFQDRRIRIAKGLELGSPLTEELINFKMNPPRATDQLEALRQGPNDDLVFSVALACWWGDKFSWNDEAYRELLPDPDIDEVRRRSPYG